MSQNQRIKYHVFLSHNRKDKPAVKDLKQRLAAQDLTVWYDEEELRPGIPWQQLLESGIESSGSVAVLVGKDGCGPWERQEMQLALRLAVEDKRPVIPVLLPGASRQPKLPRFLGNRTWVDLRSGFSDEGLERLVWGITGLKPGGTPKGEAVGLDKISRVDGGKLKPQGGTIFAIGSGNLETLLVHNGEERIRLGDKHDVTVDHLWGGSAVNVSARLLAAGLPVVPILTIGKNPAGSKICYELANCAESGGIAPRIREYIRSGRDLRDDVVTPTSTILVHGRERTIFRQNVRVPKDFNRLFNARIMDTMKEFPASPTSILLGHIPTEGPARGRPAKAHGECTRFILENAPSDALVYGVFGSTQLRLSWPFWKPLLRRVDVFQCNMEEALRFFVEDGKKPCLAEVLSLLRREKMTAVLTMDRFGAVAIYKGKKSAYIAWPLIQAEEVLDSTGAGDAFAAGMMSQLHRGRTGASFSQALFERGLCEGAIWAAAACTTMGGCGPDPRGELEKFRLHHSAIEEMELDRRTHGIPEEVVNFIDLAYH